VANVRSQIHCEAILVGATPRAAIDLETELGEKPTELAGFRYTIQSRHNPPKRLYLVMTNTNPVGKSEADLGDFLTEEDQYFNLTEAVNVAMSWESFFISADEIKQEIRLKGFKYLVLIAETGTNVDAYKVIVTLYRSKKMADKKLAFVGR